jgi:aryl-alcohol dehydrogenase-like predicted oxidoreductase
MDKLLLANTGMYASRLALGTASLHHLRRSGERERLLLTALDHGISHFDTSPLYGYGLGEASLAVLRMRPGQATVATKVGLYPPGGADQLPGAVWARKLAGMLIPAVSKPIVDLSVALACRSLEGSLRRLKRDHVDLLFLHEPRIEHLVLDEWLRWLESVRDKARWVGVAGEPDRVLPLIRAAPPLAAVVQTRDSVLAGEAEPLRQGGWAPQITYGHLAASNAKLDATAGLQAAVARYPDTVLLVSTRQVSRIAQLVHAVEKAPRQPVGLLQP